MYAYTRIDTYKIALLSGKKNVKSHYVVYNICICSVETV